MKLLRFDDDRIGILKNGNYVADVSEAISYRLEKGPQRVMEEVIADWDVFRSRFEEIATRQRGIPLDSVQLLAPVPRPSKVLAAFANYLDTPERSPDDISLEFFYKAPELVGPNGRCELLDIPPVMVWQPEAELAFVIGRHVKNVTRTDAEAYIFGYVPFFDVSARGLNRRTQFLQKGQDTYSLCGPWITTRDEVTDPHKLRVQSWVNEGLRQDYNTEYMARKIPEQIEWLSRFVQLQPGDIVATGTHHDGLGPINDGDVLEIEIECLGRSRFLITSYGPRKEAPFRPGVTQNPDAGPGITRV